MSTLNDVAREAKVSVITVSRVINTPEKVKPQTRERIQRAMDKVNYVQNPVAKALVSKRVGIIDVYIPESIDLSNPFIMHLIGGISEGLSRQMYSFLIIRDRKHEHRCDGYIATGLLKDETREMFQYAAERNRPLALFGHSEEEEIDCIDVDNIEGMRKITEYVLQNGHTNVAMIHVNEDKDYIADRYQGYCDALRKKDSALAKRVVYTANNVQGGYIAAMKILHTYKDTSALICATDDLAIGAVRAVAEFGLRVPEDVSVTGYDGLGHHLLAATPITTVRQPVYEIGKMLADTILKRIQGERTRTKHLVAPELIIEQSVEFHKRG